MRRAFDQPGHERMLRCEHEEGRAEQRVGPRREDLDLFVEAVHAEVDVRSLGAPDPVPLHRENALGPLLEQGHLVQQDVRVVGDLEEPLLEVACLDLGSAAFAVPVDDLLVRQHRLVVRAPLDRRLFSVGEPLLEEAQEQPLRPAVVLRLVRREDAIPVDRPAHAFHLAADRRDVARGRLAGVQTLLDRGVLGGQAEGVEPHRAHDREPVPASEMADDLAQHVVPDMPHVEIAGGVRQHLEDIGLLHVARELVRARIRHLEGPLVSPDALPLLLDRLCVVFVHRLLSSVPCSLGKTKEPLAREAPGERPRLSPRPLPAYVRSCTMLGKG